jgi:hypothetical protein
MNIAITLVHNKSDQENFDQVEALKSMLELVEDPPFTDEEGNSYTTHHQQIKGLDIPHTVRIYQVVPFDKERPSNWGDINTGGIVDYLKGDEDKVGDHPRFFNWGLKRGTDNGAELSIYLEDVSKFNIKRLKAKLTNDTDFDEDESCKIASVRLLREIGQLDERKARSEAISELKGRISVRGVRNG